ncbi:MAG: FkbM family methyltransferase [Desulfovibrionaceae bacterium]|nr:FkbM family methyltransferase [Desulfovibrionaceae bacterium]
MLSDEHSKYLYGQELLYCGLARYMQAEIIANFVGPITYDEFRANVNKAQYIYPEMVHPDDESSKFFCAQNKCTSFIYDQYNYKNIVSVKKDDVCLDIGACLGDSALNFLEKQASKVYSFEIDHLSIKCMQETFGKLNVQNKIEIVNSGVFSNNGSCWYTPAHLGGGKITQEPINNNSYQVPIVKLDDWCARTNCKPDFIKMDIEGAEIDALKGAESVIKNYKPKLAISIYHTWEHRYQIPLLLKEYLPDAKFYLKKSHPGGEVVIFASTR